VKITSGSSPSILGLSWRLGLWGVATWLVLSLHDSPFAEDHSICGPWGCGPTISALLAAHGFWLLVAIPGAVWASKRLAARQAVVAGWVCLGLASASIIAVASRELMSRPKLAARLEVPSYRTERILFALATTVQVPLFPTAFAGLILLNAGRRHSRSQSSLGSEAEDGCGNGRCDSSVSLDISRGAGRIAVGEPLPGLTLVTHDGQVFVVPSVGQGRASLLYFMRAADCSICRRHVRTIVRIFEENPLQDTAVFIVHPGGQKASKALENSLPTRFNIVSGRDFGAYKAIGLSHRNLGLSHGSGTILVDCRGVVRHLRFAGLPFGAFSEPRLLGDYFSIMADR